MIKKLLGAVLTMPVLVGGLLLVSAAPAAACSCAGPVSDADNAARADAVFVGRLVDRREPPQRPVMSSADPAVLTFKVSRVYKGTVTELQEIVTPQSGASCGLELTGEGPFLVFAQVSSFARYQLEPGQYVSVLCDGSRAISEGGEPLLGMFSTLRRPTPTGDTNDSPSTAGLAIVAAALFVLVVAGVTIQIRRRQPTA